jgi:nicotinamide-nucleotide amidase
MGGVFGGDLRVSNTLADRVELHGAENIISFDIRRLTMLNLRLSTMPESDAKLKLLAARVGRRLLNAQRSVATAESCTGGWIAKALTDTAGSSQWFSEGFVTYSNESKTRRLGVPRAILEKNGAVSEQTVRAMASGALRRTKAQMAVAVTGIAGPDGAVPGKPVGTVWLGWATRHGAAMRVTTQLRHFRGDRDAVRRKTVRAALEGLRPRPR